MTALRVDRDRAMAWGRHQHPPRNFLTMRCATELRRCLAALERVPRSG